jgi:hypothetical protein
MPINSRKNTPCISPPTITDGYQLDIQLLEIEDLRHALEHQSTSSKARSKRRTRSSLKNNDVAKTVVILENDLKRVRRDAEAFGKDLEILRGENERSGGRLKEEVVKGERTRKQGAALVRLLNEQLEKQREKMGGRRKSRGGMCVLRGFLFFFLASLLETVFFTDFFIKGWEAGVCDKVAA